MNEDPAAHLAELRAEAHEAQDIVSDMHRHEFMRENSPIHLEIIERIETIKEARVREELFRILERQIYG